MPRTPSSTFTDKELEIMRAVWRLGEATGKQIQEALPGERHYNSVLTIIRVLERKEHLTHRAEGRTFVYRAKVNQAKARGKILNQMVKSVFGGSPVSLVLSLVETGKLTKEDLDTIRRQLAARQKEADS